MRVARHLLVALAALGALLFLAGAPAPAVASTNVTVVLGNATLASVLVDVCNATSGVCYETLTDENGTVAINGTGAFVLKVYASSLALALLNVTTDTSVTLNLSEMQPVTVLTNVDGYYVPVIVRVKGTNVSFASEAGATILVPSGVELELTFPKRVGLYKLSYIMVNDTPTTSSTVTVEPGSMVVANYVYLATSTTTTAAPNYMAAAAFVAAIVAVVALLAAIKVLRKHATHERRFVRRV